MHAGPERLIERVRRPAVMILGVLAVALSARVSTTLPGSTVPQSAQTLAVLVVGGLLGARDGSLSLLAYLLVGGVGVPVFADGASGWTHLYGPSAGYLAGFVLAAGGVGLLAEYGHLRRLTAALGAMIGGHALILGLGWARLAWALGPEDALRQGILPFVAGGLLKSLVAAAVLFAVHRGTTARRWPGSEARPMGPKSRTRPA